MRMNLPRLLQIIKTIGSVHLSIAELPSKVCVPVFMTRSQPNLRHMVVQKEILIYIY